MSLVAGARLGPYEVLGPIGAGGMGDVYRARDPRLGREVAIKILADTGSLRAFTTAVTMISLFFQRNLGHVDIQLIIERPNVRRSSSTV